MIRRTRVGEAKVPFRRSAFVKLLLSFLCTLLIPICIGTLLYNKMEQSLIDYGNESNQSLLKQASLSIDSRMSELDQLLARIAFNPTLQLLLYSESDVESTDKYKYIELINSMKSFRTLSPFIDDYYIYLKESNRIITSSITTTPSIFFTYMQDYQNRDKQDMVRLLTQYQLKTHLPAEQVQYSMYTPIWRNIITSINTLPIGEATDVRGAIVFTIDEMELLGLLKKADKRNTDFYILNERNEVLSTTSGDRSSIEGLAERLSSGSQSGDFTTDMNGESMMVSYLKSEQNNWTYVSVLPKAVVLSKVHETQSLAVILVLICCVAGLTVSYYFAYKNHSPIRDLIQAILKDRNISGLPVKNEFAFIKRELMSAIREEKNTRSLLSQQAPLIRADFISRLIKGYVDTKALTSRDLDFMDVHFRYPSFGVILLQIDDCHQFIEEDTEREWALMRFILINMSNEMLADQGFAIEMERDRVGVLLNHEVGGTGDRAELESVVHQLRSFMKHNFRTNITIAVSRLNHGLEHIAAAYGEAVIALEYKLLQGERSVIYYEEVKHVEHHYYYYSMETESQLMNYAKSADIGNVVKVLDHIFEVNFQTRAISPDMGKYLFFELMNTVLKLCNALNMDERFLFQGESDPVKFIAKIGTADKLNEELKQWYAAICRKVEEERTDHGERMYRKVQQYIEEHYASNTLSVTAIAEHCGLNASYLSTFYKKLSGQNITEYITAMRIKRAKAYLEEGERTISQVAQLVGFTNDIGLIRVFKKSEGITPGKYKEMIQSKIAQQEAILEK